MRSTLWKSSDRIQGYDERRDIVIPGNTEAAILFAVKHFISIANQSIKESGSFTVALSGGSTPKAIFQKLTSIEFRDQVDWSQVMVFWSDERDVPLDDPESNYKMAMDAGISLLPLLPGHIFPMRPPEGDIEAKAKLYENLIMKHSASGSLDLVMLGMGEDGHTASLFPKSHGLHSKGRMVIANFIPQLDAWRLTLTFDCINIARNICIYVLGKYKKEPVFKALSGKYQPDEFPVQRVGTPSHKALWILDECSAQGIMEKNNKK